MGRCLQALVFQHQPRTRGQLVIFCSRGRLRAPEEVPFQRENQAQRCAKTRQKLASSYESFGDEAFRKTKVNLVHWVISMPLAVEQSIHLAQINCFLIRLCEWKNASGSSDCVLFSALAE